MLSTSFEGGRKLSRANFIEILLLTAVFLAASNRSNVKTEFVRFFDSVLLKRFSFDFHGIFPFDRTLLYTNEETAEVLSKIAAHGSDEKALFHQVFSKHRNFEGFAKLVSLMRIQDKFFTAEHIKAVFYLSKFPKVEEDERQKLTYEEFVEGFSRLAIVSYSKGRNCAAGSDRQSMKWVASAIKEFNETLEKKLKNSII
jgi:hypothetical protein